LPARAATEPHALKELRWGSLNGSTRTFVPGPTTLSHPTQELLGFRSKPLRSVVGTKVTKPFSGPEKGTWPKSLPEAILDTLNGPFPRFDLWGLFLQSSPESSVFNLYGVCQHKTAVLEAKQHSILGFERLQDGRRTSGTDQGSGFSI
jgi:hypothetical protein